MGGAQNQYEVLRTFVASYGGTIYTGVQGDVKPLSDEVAGWIERDSPGRLCLVVEEPKVKRKKRAARAARPRSDRMVRESEDR